jgi:hypothetical protein
LAKKAAVNAAAQKAAAKEAARIASEKAAAKEALAATKAASAAAKQAAIAASPEGRLKTALAAGQAIPSKMQAVSVSGGERRHIAVMIPLGELQTNEPLVALLPVTTENVKLVQDAMAVEGQQYPIKIGTDNVIIDGHTRWAAAAGLKWPEIAAERLDILGASPEGLELGLSLNTNKRHLSRADRRSMMSKLLTLHPEWSNNRIGVLIGMSGETVRSRRGELEESGKIEPQQTVTSASGKVQAKGATGTNPASAPRPKFPKILLREPGKRMILPTKAVAIEAAENLLAWSDVIAKVMQKVPDED